MTLTELQAQIVFSEDSRRLFKQDIINADSLTAEMAAFANSEGDTIYLGVAISTWGTVTTKRRKA